MRAAVLNIFQKKKKISTDYSNCSLIILPVVSHVPHVQMIFYTHFGRINIYESIFVVRTTSRCASISILKWRIFMRLWNEI